jgi:hypothetical protein
MKRPVFQPISRIIQKIFQFRHHGFDKTIVWWILRIHIFVEIAICAFTVAEDDLAFSQCNVFLKEEGEYLSQYGQ